MDQRAFFQLIQDLFKLKHRVQVVCPPMVICPSPIVRQPGGEKYIQATEHRVN